MLDSCNDQMLFGKHFLNILSYIVEINKIEWSKPHTFNKTKIIQNRRPIEVFSISIWDLEHPN